MIKALFAAALLLLPSNALSQTEEGPFLKVSDHCYVLHVEASGENIAVIISDQGVLLFDPPPEPDLSVLVESLNTITHQPVRWMVRTGFSHFRTEGVDYFAQRGAVLLAGFNQSVQPVPQPVLQPDPLPWLSRGFSGREDRGDPLNPEIPFSGRPGIVEAVSDAYGREPFPVPQIIFKDDLFLYPDDLEVRIEALDQEARTRADIFAYVPDEKVLFAGRLFEPFYYPDVGILDEGSALKWIDGLQRVIDSVPLLISAIPPEKPDEENGDAKMVEKREATEGRGAPAEEEEEPTLEELVAVIPSRGEVSNLQVLKDTLEASKALRNGISRSIKAGRSCERFLNASSTDKYRIYGNFSSFTAQLCSELSNENNKPE